MHAHEMMRKQCVSWPPLNKGVFVSQGNSALKDHPRLKHLLEAFKAKQEGQEKHNKASGDFWEVKIDFINHEFYSSNGTN